MGQTRCSVARPLEEAVPAGSRHDERPPRWDRVGRRRPPRPLPLGSGYLGGPRSGSSRLARPPRREVGACGRARTDGAEEIWRAAAPSELRCGVGCCSSPRVGRWQRRLQVNGAGPGRGAAGREPGSVPMGSGPHPRAAGGRTDGRMAAGGWLARPASCTDIECFRFVAASPEVRKLQRDQYPHSAAPLTGAGKGDARSSASLSLQGIIGYYRQVSFKLGGSWGCRCLNKPEPKQCGHCGGSPQTARGVRCAPGSSGVPSRPSASRLHSLLEGRAGKRCGCVGGC